jgi:hypothetical protein
VVFEELLFQRKEKARSDEEYLSWLSKMRSRVIREVGGFTIERWFVEKVCDLDEINICWPRGALK